jgi:hypothetical protein
MRRHKKLISIASATLTLLAASFLIGFKRWSPQGSAQTVAFKPFVLHEQETTFNSDKVAIKEVDFTIARRADGSLMKSFPITGTDSPSGKDAQAVLIWEVANRQDIALEPFTNSVMTQHRSPKEVSDFVGSQHECAADGVLSSSSGRSTSTMLGHLVVQIEQNSATLQSVSWVAPDLDCYPLKKTNTFLDPKHAGTYQEIVVTKLDEGIPPATMFTVPSDYTERSPLQIEAQYTRQFSGHSFFGRDNAKNAEHQYQRHQDQVILEPNR